MRITAPMPEQHLKRLSKIVVHHQETGGITFPEKSILALELFQKIVHAILIDEKTVWIVLIAFLSHSHHLIPNKTVVAEHLP